MFECSYTFDRLQDKFQLPDLVRLFAHIKTFLDTSGQPFDYNPPVVGMAHGYLLRSSNKILGDYIIAMPEPDETNPNDAISQISLIVDACFQRKWQQLRDALYTPYDPLSPLDYTDHRTVNRTDDASSVESKLGTISTSGTSNAKGTEAHTAANDRQETVNRTNLTTYGKTIDTMSQDNYSQSQSNTKTGNTGESISRNSTGTKDDGHFGFNASAVSPVTSSDLASAESTLRDTSGSESEAQVNAGLDNLSKTERNTGADTESGSDTHESHDSGTSVVSRSSDDFRVSDRTENATGTRQERGDSNEDATTRRTGRYLDSPQDLIRKEFVARQKTLLDTIYADLDAVLCIPVY